MSAFGTTAESYYILKTSYNSYVNLKKKAV